MFSDDEELLCGGRKGKLRETACGRVEACGSKGVLSALLLGLCKC